MPIVLPTTRPRITPHVTGLLNASPNWSAGRLMPALASAKSGTITNADHGCRMCTSHSTTDTLDRAWSTTRRASSTDGETESSSASM